MRPFRFSLVGICLTLSLVPAVAFGDASVKSRAAARDAEGRRLMAAKDYAGACAKFGESQSLAPTSAAALDLGVCYERSGKLASAWFAYKMAAAAAVATHQTARALAARKLMSSVESKTPRLTVNVADRARVSGLEVRCDDGAIDPADWGNALPRDGGGHDIQASAPGKKTWRTHVDLRGNSQTVAVDVPLLEDEAHAKAGPAKVANEAHDSEAPAVAEVVSDKPAHPGQTQRVVGIVVGSVGFAGVAAGVIAGISANSANSDLKSACGSGPTCDATNASKHDSAIMWAAISDIAFIAGGAAVATGAVIYFTAPRESAAVSSVGIAPAARGAGLSLIGRF